MPTVSFAIALVAGKARPRVLRSGRAYTPARTVQAEDAVRDAYRVACRRRYGTVLMAAAHVPVNLVIRTQRPLPKGRPTHVASEPDTYKYDWDNIGKLVSDALSAVAYVDDAQVTRALVEKRPRVRGAAEATEITVSWGDEIALLGGTNGQQTNPAGWPGAARAQPGPVPGARRGRQNRRPRQPARAR